nr:uncharacterized protein LOC117686226 isoform X1 [Crassostrea gigas]
MKILVTIALTVIIVQLSSIECQHPQYSFRCLENGNIVLFGLHEHSQLISYGDCTPETFATGRNYHRILKDCGQGEGDFTVNITVYDPDIDGSTKKPHNNNNTNAKDPLIGGHGTHSFTVTCESIPQEGINKTVVHVFEGNEFNVLAKNKIEVDGVEMRFKAVNDINSPDINTIYVGDEFFMFLEYKGTKEYNLIPLRCTAYSGTSLNPTSQTQQTQTKVELWNRDSSTDCTPNDELLQDFKPNVPSKLIYAEMFGFRFSDSAYITIQCEVGIFSKNTKEPLCKQPTTSSSTTLSTSATTGSGNRKRRGIENVEVKTKFAASKIRVYDNKDMYQMENKSPQQSFDISVRIVLVIGILMNRW